MIRVGSLSQLVKEVARLKLEHDQNFFVFRGEGQYWKDTALVPGVYRKPEFLKKEHTIFKEMQRFNDKDFTSDTSSFDYLSRIQHYSAPSRLLDVSEDLLSAVYFAVENHNPSNGDAVVYVLEIDHNKVKYFDSDAVSVVANLAKLPLKSQNNKKSKHALLEKVKDVLALRSEEYSIVKFNRCESAKFLVHEIGNEKPHFRNIVNPEHIISTYFVWPKLTSNRLRSQKGAFILFGLNFYDEEKPISLIKGGRLFRDEYAPTPLVNLHVFALKKHRVSKIKEQLYALGIKKPFIYPEMDKVAEYLKR